MCLLMDSPPMDAEEEARCDSNHLWVAQQGRDPGLRLDAGDRARGVCEWGKEIVAAMSPICELLDVDGDGSYTAALALQREKLLDPARTPSARILEALRLSDESFFEFATRLSANHREYFLQLPELEGERAATFEREALASIGRQHMIEASDDIAFEAFLQRYFDSA